MYCNEKQTKTTMAEELTFTDQFDNIVFRNFATNEECDKLVNKIAEAQDKLDVLKSFEPEKTVL